MRGVAARMSIVGGSSRTEAAGQREHTDEGRQENAAPVAAPAKSVALVVLLRELVECRGEPFGDAPSRTMPTATSRNPIVVRVERSLRKLERS